MKVEYLLPNLVIGSLTRDSIHQAIDHGISVGEVNLFLERNAHARMLTGRPELCRPVVPDTVLDQMHLWARERHRLHVTHARLYEGFTSEAEFAAAEQYAADCGVCIWAHGEADGRKCALLVNAVSHADMKSFLRSWR